MRPPSGRVVVASLDTIQVVMMATQGRTIILMFRKSLGRPIDRTPTTTIITLKVHRSAMKILEADSVEAFFVDNFVLSERRERSRFELGSKNKRRKFFSRLSARDSILILSEAQYLERADSQSESVQIRSCVNELGCEAQCYLMSYEIEYDRKFCSANEGISIFVDCQMECVLIFPMCIAFVRTEWASSATKDIVLR